MTLYEFELSSFKYARLIKEEDRDLFMRLNQVYKKKATIDLQIDEAKFILYNQKDIISRMEEKRIGTVYKNSNVSIDILISSWWSRESNLYACPTLLAFIQKDNIMRITSGTIPKLCGLIHLLLSEVDQIERERTLAQSSERKRKRESEDYTCTSKAVQEILESKTSIAWKEKVFIIKIYIYIKNSVFF
jgi:hypothetical protein